MRKKRRISVLLFLGLFAIVLCAGVFLWMLFPDRGGKEQQREEVQEQREAGEQREIKNRKELEDQKETEDQREEDQKESEKILTETAVHYQIVYNMEVTSASMAAAAIAEEGRRQREAYDNPEVEAIELKMEEEFGILAVNLGEMSVETAEAVYAGFSYMYEKYPCLQGSLTNLTLGNMGNKTGGTVALTDRMAFIVNGDYGRCPFVEKYYIVLNARAFLHDEKLKKNCAELSASGYWPEGANPSSILVHELGHQLQNVIVQRKFGLECPYYITEENVDAFSLYNTDRLSPEDNVTTELLNKAYRRWKEVYGNRGDYETFVKSISDYAMGDEKTDRYSASETFAEALADVYLNGENAAEASRAVAKIIDEVLASDEGIFEY